MNKTILKKYLAEIIFIILLIIIVIIAFLFDLGTTRHSHKKRIEVEPNPKLLAWGFHVDSIQIDTFQVRPNQNLSDILINQGISATSIDALVKSTSTIFDVRRFKTGNSYYLINNDSIKPPEYFIYEISAVDYIVYDLDSLFAFRGQKQIDTLRKTTAGIIETSLWNSFIDNGSNPALALELSDIFAWTVDFFGIQRGDQYKVYYDELYVEDKFVGFGRIHAASFFSMGDTIYAFDFSRNGQEGYFDNKGQSLKKAFLKAPLTFSRISSKFSNNRLHPVLKIRRPHHGVDYAAPTGTPVNSIGDGVVVKKAYQAGGGGNYITIKHNSVYTSQYMHLNGYAKGISAGVRVKQGQLIGYVGKTGLASGPHLDFRIFKNGSPVDPLQVKAPPVEPISESNLLVYISQRDSLKRILDGIVVAK